MSATIRRSSRAARSRVRSGPGCSPRPRCSSTWTRRTYARGSSHAVGMRVIGLRRTPASPIDGVERVFGPDGLHALLANSDYVVLILPYTSETDGLLDAAAISHMKPGAVLINMARGSLVDEQALV